MVIRLQCKDGRFVLDGITGETTLGQLQLIIQKKTNVLPEKQKILYSYPPKEIATYDPKILISEINIKKGDTITLQELTEKRQPEFTSHNNKCILERKVVPADNSCLFRSISILINGEYTVKEMRELVAGVIISQPDKYTPAVLGKSQEDYIQWIMKDDSWGGGIELLVFSELFKVELDVINIQTLRIDQFGDGKGYINRGLLIYDGIHYDPIVMKSLPGGSTLQCLFPLTEDTILIEALKIAEEANKLRQYTDVANFKLRCLVCNELLKGHTDAQLHAKKTGHINFGEV